jgi:uncharacterized protein with ParB-like and HNH nuclease domain
MALDKSNKQWSGKKIFNMMESGEIKCDHYVQRDLVWDYDKNSLFIHSLLAGYPVPALFAAKRGEQYHVLDGKQRINALVEYMSDAYVLTLDGAYQEIPLKSGEVFDLEDAKFSALPEELQDRIKDFSFTIYYYDEIPDEEIEEIFYRLNNGKALTPIELAMSKAKSKEVIWELSAHELMQMINKLRRNRYKAVAKAYAIMFNKTPSHAASSLKSILVGTQITKEQEKAIRDTFDKLLSIYRLLSGNNEKIAKRFIKETHLITLMRLASRTDQDGLRRFIMEFFGAGGRGTTPSETYNNASKHGSAKPESIARRLTEIQDYYDAHIKLDDDDFSMSLDDLPDDEQESAVG